MIKIFLYIVFFPFVIWLMESLNLNKIFKPSRVIQARFMYLIIAMCITYLATNFLYDFFLNCNIV